MSRPHRRTFLKGLVGTLALGTAGTATGHPAGGSHDIHIHHASENAELVGFHPLGATGPEPTLETTDEGTLEYTGDDPLYGVCSEVWAEDDLAFVSMLSTSEPTGNRGVAIVDVSEYTRADDRAALHDATMEVVSYIGNETEAGTAADVKVSDDGQYLFYSKQTFGWDYGQPASPATDPQEAPGAEPLGIAAYDISDPANPRYIGTAQGPNAGFHNCFTHRIGGEHYVFGVQGVAPGDAGVHVFRLVDEDAGGLEPVNFWSGENLSQGGYDTPALGPYAGGYYCHDFYAHDDPVTGRPLGFVAYWDHGVRVLDLSDPTDIEELGYGSMRAAHYAQPAPTLIDGKRVFVGGQEHSSKTEGISGEVRLFDGDDLFEDGLTECPTLDVWTLYERVTYEGYAFSPHNCDITRAGVVSQAHYHAGVQYLAIQSPAESETGEWRLAGRRYDSVDRYEIDAGGESFEGIIGPGALGSTRETHEFTPPGGEDVGGVDATLSWTENTQDNDFYLERNTSGDPDDPEWEEVAASRTLNGPEHIEAAVEPGILHRFVVETFANAAAEYTIDATYIGLEVRERTLAEAGPAYYRDHVEVPEESVTMDRIMSPNFWGARVENGVTFAAGTNSGLYAIAADPIEVGTRTPVEIDVERSGDGPVRSSGETRTLKYEIETDKGVHIRDRLPADWEVTGGDPTDVTDVGDGTRVEFRGAVPPAHGRGPTTLTLEVEVGGDGGQRVGPVRYSGDGGETWEPVVGTTADGLTLP